MHETFREGDLMPWQQMTKEIKGFNHQLDSVAAIEAELARRLQDHEDRFNAQGGIIQGMLRRFVVLEERLVTLQQKFREHETLLRGIIKEANDQQVRLDDLEAAMGDVFSLMREGEFSRADEGYQPNILPTGEEEDEEGDYPSNI